MKDISKELESAKAALKEGYKIRLWLNLSITVDTIEDMLTQIASISKKIEDYEIQFGGFDQIHKPD